LKLQIQMIFRLFLKSIQPLVYHFNA
jgi:hypothetical protein